jgi:arginine/lysine/ornithine decarboxylase
MILGFSTHKILPDRPRVNRQLLDQTQFPLLASLQTCANRRDAPFYTPGHKHGAGTPDGLRTLLGMPALQADLPELPDLDNLFAPQGVIQEAQELAAAAFGAEQTWFLTNGSTGGILAAILATCHPGDKIILARNMHQSAISGLVLAGAMPVFLQPEYDPQLDIAHSITPEAVTEALSAHPDARAVMMVSPTYYGVCGNVAAIAQRCHQYSIPLLVDEAHGSHFAFHPDLPTPALAAGADLSVQSIHKTLSALTQAAMLHVQGDRIERDRLTRTLALVQSTSPNYLLLASLDAARHQMATQGKKLLEQTLSLARQASAEIAQIPGLSLLTPDQAKTPGFTALDPTRLTVTVAGLGIDGFRADEILHNQFGVICELASLQHLTFIITPGNQATDIHRLVCALKSLPSPFSPSPSLLPPLSSLLSPLPSPLPPLSPRQAFCAPTETLPIAQATGHISTELICPYPPGIPVLMPGEVVTEAAIAYLQQVLAAGGIISGCSDPGLQTLKVVRM